MRAEELPDFASLPNVPGSTLQCSWGLFDHHGKRDNLGCLNLLTPEVVLDAVKEIRHGLSISLNWPLNNVEKPGFGRKAAEHKIIDNSAGGGPWGHDDELHINTQSGSQWDGFRHWAHQDLKLYYNGLKHEDISGPMALPHNGIEHWNKRGCIAARGVLIDYASWAQRRGIHYNPFTKHCITVDDIEVIAKEQNVEFKPGDILIVRTGTVQWYERANTESRIKATSESHAFTGVEGSEASISWIWNHHFAAIASDAVGFESWPAKPEWKIHDWCLALLGIPIGELWDLEELAKECQRQKKWSFFLTSAPLNVEGGVASPPNAIAIL